MKFDIIGGVLTQHDKLVALLGHLGYELSTTQDSDPKCVLKASSTRQHWHDCNPQFDHYAEAKSWIALQSR